MSKDFERESLFGFLEVMSSERIERDYQPEWLDGKLDFFFPNQNIGICYLNGKNSAANPKAIEQLRSRGITLHTFTISEVCKQAILDHLPSICDSAKISKNKDRLHGIMSRFIKEIMREIRAEEADFGKWTTREDMIDMSEEKRELESEAQADIINAGEETDVIENSILTDDEEQEYEPQPEAAQAR